MPNLFSVWNARYSDPDKNDPIDHISALQHEEAVRFIDMYGEKQAIDIVNFHIETYERELTFRQMFGDFKVRM